MSHTPAKGVAYLRGLVTKGGGRYELELRSAGVRRALQRLRAAQAAGDCESAESAYAELEAEAPAHNPNGRGIRYSRVEATIVSRSLPEAPPARGLS